jgi:hypothetical protein
VVEFGQSFGGDTTQGDVPLAMHRLQTPKFGCRRGMLTKGRRAVATGPSEASDGRGVGEALK